MNTDPIHESIESRTKCLHSPTDLAQPDVQVPTIDTVSHDSEDEDEDNDSTHTRYEKSSLDIEDLSTSDGVMSIEELKLLVQIFGTESLKKKLRKLLRRFQHIFSSTVSPEAARVDNPMEVKINSSQWFSKHNRLPPRAQSQKKEEELKKYIQALLLNNVIQPSTATAWSQVLLVPKPGVDVWRLCIDYRNLNAITLPTEGHPLPRIDHMLRRLGSRRAKYFGVLDLTAGYHQTPLSPEAIPLTAFICFMGLFEFTRTPMGLVNAASYFQRFISVVVLAGLMYSAVEAYIDDVIIYGQDEDDFVKNVEAVFL